MTRDEAIAEAQRRNVEDFRRTGTLDAIWTEFERRPGEWTVCLNEKGRPPLWRRALREAVETVIELPEAPDRVWRRRFPAG